MSRFYGSLCIYCINPSFCCYTKYCFTDQLYSPAVVDILGKLNIGERAHRRKVKTSVTVSAKQTLSAVVPWQKRVLFFNWASRHLNAKIRCDILWQHPCYQFWIISWIADCKWSPVTVPEWFASGGVWDENGRSSEKLKQCPRLETQSGRRLAFTGRRVHCWVAVIGAKCPCCLHYWEPPPIQLPPVTVPFHHRPKLRIKHTINKWIYK